MIITLTTPEPENLLKGYEHPKTKDDYFVAKGIAAEIAERRGESTSLSDGLREEIDDLKREVQAERDELHDAECSVAGKQMIVDGLTENLANLQRKHDRLLQEMKTIAKAEGKEQP